MATNMHTYVHNSLGMSGLYIQFAAGGIYDTVGRMGIGHLMEHLVCKTFDHKRDWMQYNGISYGAYTSSNKVVVQFTGLSSRLDDAQRELVSLVTGGIDCVTEDMFEAEKKTVLEEYADTFVDTLTTTLYNGFRQYYDMYGAIGLADDIRDFTYDDMKNVYDKVFRHPLKIISVGPSGINLPGIEYMDFESVKPYRAIFDASRTAVPIEEKHDAKCATVCYTRPCCSEDYSRLSIGMDMLCNGLNSPLYQELREKRGLTYFVMNFGMEFYDSAVMCFGCNYSPENAGTVISMLDEFVESVGDYMNEKRFEICRNRARVMKETTDVLRFENVDNLFVSALKDRYDEIDTMTFGQVFDTVKRYIHPNGIAKYSM